jgi:hypothetical protein
VVLTLFLPVYNLQKRLQSLLLTRFFSLIPPSENAVDVWARTFSALGINYKSSTMTLDLCDREGKYRWVGQGKLCEWKCECERKSDREGKYRWVGV